MEFKDIKASELARFDDFDNHETVRRFHDPETGLTAFVALHNTNLGPALGGCRMMKYESEDDAIRDVLRLSRGMTYKNALARLPLGGGKAVIIGDPFARKTESLMAVMGQAIESFEGRYITAEDSGTNERDMAIIAKETSYVVGLPSGHGAGGEGSDLGGDPSPYTAYGVYCGMKAAVNRRYGGSQLAGLKVAIQGLGAVGFELAKLLNEDGVELIITDVRQESLDKARQLFDYILVTPPGDIFQKQANIFAPCAVGAQINDDTVPKLKAEIIAGAANNQLAEARHGDALKERDILYAPDYVINAGGVIAVAYEYFSRAGGNPFGYELNRPNMAAHIREIGNMLEDIFILAEKEDITPARAADRLAESLFLNPASSGKRNGSTSKGPASSGQDAGKKAVL